MNVYTPGFNLLPQMSFNPMRAYRKPHHGANYNHQRCERKTPYYVQDYPRGLGVVDPRRGYPQGGACERLGPAQDATLAQMQGADQKKANSTAHLQKMGFRKMTPDEIKAYSQSRMDAVRKFDGIGDVSRWQKDMAATAQDVQNISGQGNELWTRDDGKRVRLATDGSVNPF